MSTKKEDLSLVLDFAKKHGYKAYIHLDKDEYYIYGWLVTPSNNILYIQHAPLIGGFDVSLQYKPDVSTGSGCGCNKAPIHTFTVEILQQLEQNGLALARRFGAILYTEEEKAKYFTSCWNAKDIQEV